MNEQIIMIPRNKLFAHPDNPRKVLGDCAEMADSIKAMGILQPLVVVPYNPAEHPEIKTDEEDCYVTVIGHRRRKGGMMAEVEAYPAIVKNLTLTEQIATMLVENGNREDLTRQEEAQAIQQMFDLGENLESVCKMTGFSRETIRTRRKLLDLDQDKLAEAEARGGTLSDYMKLDEISDPALKNEVLDSIGTKNFNAELQRAKDAQKRKEIIMSYVPMIEKFAERINKADQDTMRYLGNYSWWNKREVEIPADSDTVKYFYVVGNEQIDLYCTKDASEVAEKATAQAAAREASEAAEKRNQELEELALRAFDLRTQFVHNLTTARVKKHFGAVVSFVGQYLLSKANTQVAQFLNIDSPMMGDMLGISTDAAGISVDMNDFEESARRVPEYNLLVTAYLLAESNSLRYHQKYSNYLEHRYTVKHTPNEQLDSIYALLGELGYVISDEEIAYKNGSHEMFDKVNSEEVHSDET